MLFEIGLRVCLKVPSLQMIQECSGECICGGSHFMRFFVRSLHTQFIYFKRVVLWFSVLNHWNSILSVPLEAVVALVYTEIVTKSVGCLCAFKWVGVWGFFKVVVTFNPGLGFSHPKPVFPVQNGINWDKPVFPGFSCQKQGKTGKNYVELDFKQKKYSENVLCQINLNRAD